MSIGVSEPQPSLLQTRAYYFKVAMPFWGRRSDRPPQMYLVRAAGRRRATPRGHHAPGHDLVPYETQGEEDEYGGHAEGRVHEGHGGHGEHGDRERRRYGNEYGLPAGPVRRYRDYYVVGRWR